MEQKQVAQQLAERAKFIVQRAEQEQQAAVIRAEGDAEAARMVSEMMSKHGSQLVDLRRIEAAREITKNLSNSKNVSYLPGGNLLMQINPQ